MINKRILKSGIIFIVIISTIVGIAVYNNYITIGDGPNKKIITDSLGREVKVPDVINIKKIVGINPGGLRLITYMDAENLVCGVEDYERYESSSLARPYNFAYPEFKSLPSIGPQFGGDPELILNQEPDLIFASYITVGEANGLQSLTGIPVVALIYGDLNEGCNDFYDSLRIMGEVLGKGERAEELIGYIEGMIDDLDNRTKVIPDTSKEWCYVGGVSYSGVHGITSTECQYTPLKLINGKNSAENISTPDGHAYLDIEILFEWEMNNKLDNIIIDAGGYDMSIIDLQNKTLGMGAGDLDCIKGEPPNAVMTLPYNEYTLNFATVFIDAYYLGNRFFPEHFSDLNYTNGNIYNEIYVKFLGVGVYHEMATSYVNNYYGFHNISHSEIDNYV